jgi:hypothetical protein
MKKHLLLESIEEFYLRLMRVLLGLFLFLCIILLNVCLIALLAFPFLQPGHVRWLC